MHITIIIPVLNEESTIAGLLATLQPMRRQGHSVVVVDGGSSDRTLAACAGSVDAVRVTAAGRARQMNEGARAATGDILLFLHADTLLPGDAEARLAEFLGSSQSWGRFDVRLSGMQKSYRLIEFMINVRSWLSGIATGDQAIFVRRRVFEQVGGFPTIPLMEDLELSSRLRSCSWPYRVDSPVVTSSRRWEEKGIWRTVVLMWRLRLEYWLGVPADLLVKRYYRK